jgi:Flp pilus assembly protein TadG
MRPSGRPAGRHRIERGSAVVDFVLVLVVLIPPFLGILQVALVLHVRNTLVSAASEGARYGATADRSLADAEAKTREQIDGAISARFAQNVSASSTSIGGAPAVEVRVEATVPALGIGGPGIHLSVVGHAVEEQP